jgi:hypothetical protein
MNCMRNQPHEADGSSPIDQVYAPLHLHQKKFTPRQQLPQEMQRKKRLCRVLLIYKIGIDFGAPRREAKIVHLGRQVRSPRAAAIQHGPRRPFNSETTAAPKTAKDRGAFSAPRMASGRERQGLPRPPAVSRA